MLENLKLKLKLYIELVRLNRPIGIYLLLWPTLWALAIAAEGAPNLWILFVFVSGVVLMRSAGCAINDYADRDIDKHVSRTANRPITSGRLPAKEALMVSATLCFLAFILVLTLNLTTIYWSFGGVILAVTYPFMKRYHYLPQVHLGAAFSWGVPMAFAAQTGEVPKIAWLIYTAAMLWTVAYDTLYSMVDRQDDLKLGLKSTAILFGENDRMMVGLLQILFILTLWLIGSELDFSGIYYFSLLFAAVLLAYQQAMIIYRLPEYCFQAFLHNHWVGAVVFAGIMLHYYSL